MTFRKLCWLIPALVTLHNSEEALTMPRWVMANLALIRENLPAAFEIQFTPAQLLFSLLIATVVPLVVTIFCIGGEKGSRRLFLLFLLQAIVLLNVFIPHISISVRIGRYNPGLITAVCVNLPFSIYLFRRAFKERYLTLREFALLFVLACIVYGPVAWMLHFGGEWMANVL